LRNERNLQIHCSATILFLVWCLIIRPANSLVTLGIVMCTLVWSAELMNTALERVTDLAASGQFHVLAKLAKDMAAGAVLLVCFGTLCVGWLIVWQTVPWKWQLLTPVHWRGAVESCVALLLVFILLGLSRRVPSD
jgi:diacylglycerol kinase (ATP)